MTIKVTYNITDVYMSQSVSPVYINVSYSDGGASGGGVWGTITGTLSNQTDLQTALDGKFDDPTGTTSQYIRGDGTLATFPALTGYVPYTGATTNVNLGEYELKAGQLTLDITPTGTAAVGTTRWNDTIGATETTLKGGSVVLKNGVDLVARVVNKVTPNTTLTKAAYQAVRISGAQGQRLAVALAQANNDTNSADTIGLVTETIATNQEGFIMTMGQLENINTTGSLQGETWVDGDVLYLSPTTAGAITNVQPTGSGHIVVIGYVEYAHANNGKIYVKVLNGWELTELHDTEIISPANNEALIYESSTALWKNKTIATALGYTPANAATTLTINGVTYDLSTSRTWTISTGISGSGASGQVTYWTGSSAVSGSNNLFWDNAQGRLGIGTNAPAVKLDVVGNTTNLNTAQFGTIGIQSYNVNNAWFGDNVYFDGGQFRRRSAGVATLFYFNGSESQFRLGTDGIAGSVISDLRTILKINLDGSIGLGGNMSSGASVYTNAKVVIFGATGNVGIGTTSDLGVRLGVVGDTILRGSGATNATTALTVQNSSSTNLFTVRNDGISRFGTTGYDTATVATGVIIGSSGVEALRLSLASGGDFQDCQFIATSISSGSINSWSIGQRRDTAFGNAIGSFQIIGAYRNNSGVGSTVGGGFRVPLICNPNGDVLINGGNANVVNGLIGLKVNAPTAHVDIIASTTANASLRIRSGTAPTTPNDGDIWFDGTDIKMRIGGVTKTFTLV